MNNNENINNESNQLSHSDRFSLEDIIPEHKESQEKDPAKVVYDMVAQENAPQMDNFEQNVSENVERRHKKRVKRDTLEQRRQKALLQKMEAQMAYLLKENEDLKKQTILTGVNALENAEDALLAKRVAVKEALSKAREDGDVETETEALDLLTQIHADQKEITRQKQEAIYRSQNQPDNSQFYGPDYYRHTSQENDFEDRDPVFEEWVSKNQWVNPHSEEFDQDLANDAENARRHLDKELKLSRHSHLIGTPEYYEEISRRVYDAYGIQTKQNKQMRQRPNLVSPSSYGSSYVNNGYRMQRTPSDIALTKEETEFALKVMGPGQNLTSQQKIERFKMHKMKLLRNERHRQDPNRFDLVDYY